MTLPAGHYPNPELQQIALSLVFTLTFTHGDGLLSLFPSTTTQVACYLSFPEHITLSYLSHNKLLLLLLFNHHHLLSIPGTMLKT